MRVLRSKNVDKHQKNDLDVKYCVCRKGLSGFMLQCELCKDWFHSKSQESQTKTIIFQGSTLAF
jgi:hypothetical protein